MSRGEILAYTWDFGDGDTAAGEVVDHTFAKSGEHTVELAVVDSNGRTAETEVTFTVGERASESDSNEGTRTSAVGDESQTGGGTTTSAAERPLSDGEDTDADGDDADVETPGFGVGTALASVGGAVYLLGRRLRDDRDA